ncbi:MAG: ATP-binding protein [Caldilineaceae bacterium]
MQAHSILSITEEELSRIVLDIHDGPVQYQFTALSLLAEIQNEVQQTLPHTDLAPRLAQVAMLLESSLYEIRSFLGAFRPPEFRKRSLISIFEGLIFQHEEWTHNTVEFVAEDVPDEVALPVKIALYRILQEALANTYRHAGVEQYTVRVWSEESDICLAVIDDGRGFDPSQLAQITDDTAQHIGLRGMKERVALLGGAFDLISQPEQGTRLLIRVPAAV